MSSRNNGIISDYIEESVKRLVRQRDGFGCIRCGNPYYQYDHFAPEFHEASEHRVEGIWLLCGACHDMRHRGVISLDTLKECFANPACKRAGFAGTHFDIKGHPEIRIGNTIFQKSGVLLKIFDHEIFKVKEPENDESPFRICASFYDKDESLSLEIVDNEWRAYQTNWDVSIRGPRTIIRRGPRDIVLIMKSEPPHRIALEQINMTFGNSTFSIESNGTASYKGPDSSTISFNGDVIVEGPRGIVIDGRGVRI